MAAVWVIAILVLCPARGLTRGTPGQDPDVARRVEAVLDDWRAGKHASREKTAEHLAALGRGASPYLCRLVDERKESLPAEAIADALGQSGSRTSVPTLGRMLAGSVPAERVAAVDALQQLQLQECLPYLVAAVDDGEAAVVARAQAALREPGRASRWLVGAISERLPRVGDKSRLARLLGELGSEDAHEVLIDLLTSLDQRSKLAALQGLEILQRAEDGPRVHELIDWTQPAAVKKQACLYLGRVRYRPATRDLIELLYETNRSVAVNAHWALGAITGLHLKNDPDLWEQWWERVGKGPA